MEFVQNRPDKGQINLLDLDRSSMEAFFAEMGEKRFRAGQMVKWIHQQGAAHFDEMTNLSKELRARLQQCSGIRVPKIVYEQKSKDGTRKWLLEMNCGNRVETVYIPERERATLCISSQVGCALECSFCSTGQQGFNRNLSVAEIIGQLRIASAVFDTQRPISNVVMMGMGEPLLNFNNVVSAMSLMMDDFAYGLSKRRVTLSTSGVVPALYRLREVTDVALAVSLHASNDELRDKLVPINKKYPIKELLKACKHYFAETNQRKITFEYVMLDGINDSPAQANALCKLLSDIPSKINLIPFNPFPNTDYRCSKLPVIERFQKILMNAGYVTTVRKTRGDDIDAACGQLVGKVADRSRRSPGVAAAEV